MKREGYVEHRGGNSYRLEYSRGFDENGKRRRLRRLIEATSMKEAEAELRKWIAEITAKNVVEFRDQSFSQYAAWWLKHHVNVHLAPKTRTSYTNLMKRATEFFGSTKLSHITPARVSAFYRHLANEGIRKDKKGGRLSQSTIHHYHRMLSSMFSVALRNQYVLDNPMVRVQPPRVRRSPAKFLDEQQTAMVLAHAEKEPLKYQAALLLGVIMGLRKGEIMGLEWLDIDFGKGTLRIRQTSQYIGKSGGVITAAPKNEYSVRVISVPTTVLDLLRRFQEEHSAHRILLGDLWQGSERVFTTFEGKPMHPDTICKWFSKFLSKHRLPSISFHGLRHTAATLMISQDIPTRYISDRLGHSSSSTTLNIYGHVLRSKVFQLPHNGH